MSGRNRASRRKKLQRAGAALDPQSGAMSPFILDLPAEILGLILRDDPDLTVLCVSKVMTQKCLATGLTFRAQGWSHTLPRHFGGRVDIPADIGDIHDIGVARVVSSRIHAIHTNFGTRKSFMSSDKKKPLSHEKAWYRIYSHRTEASNDIVTRADVSSLKHRARMVSMTRIDPCSSYGITDLEIPREIHFYIWLDSVPDPICGHITVHMCHGFYERFRMEPYEMTWHFPRIGQEPAYRSRTVPAEYMHLITDDLINDVNTSRDVSVIVTTVSIVWHIKSLSPGAAAELLGESA